MEKTSLAQLLNVKHPIIMAPMFLVTNTKMMIEAMNSGIASCIPALNFRTIEELENAINEIRNNKIRIGGMVKNKSIIIKSKEINFIITDFKNEISVSYSGAVPNLFEEGKGVVAEGFLKDRSFLVADKILAKHDENYMPPEVKEALEGK